MSNLELAKRFTEGWTGARGEAKGRPEEIIALLTSDVVYRDLPLEHSATGIDVVSKRIERYLNWVDRVDIDTLSIAEAATGEIFMHRNEVYTIGAHRITLEVVSILTFRDGKISSITDCWDGRGMERQLAAIRGEPTTCEQAILD